MPPQEFSLRLQRGIAGGFAPPTPEAIYTITAAASQPVLQVTAAERPHGTPELQDALPKTLSADSHSSALIDELHAILKTLPTEYPPGSEDIYGLDTSIAFGSADLMWTNGGPSGCGGGSSQTQATDDDKKNFKRAVDIVKELVAKAS
ncbi:hypothetical protein CERSUDRAFT_115115 [Gelatoporia subvermispora B]|uniref:Uncharacterized protein n=1 Tax=Ceriporiopsis subvermispora (strain B) TaxID=914234 RepID=M2QYI3_CERS8|nr:hypothetical protein CERSUDRAFT_115115 [Gelatoporia subvermispora B]